MTNSPKIEFEVLVDTTFIDLVKDSPLVPITNKHVLSLINDFEDGDWRHDQFQSFIWNNIAETALSQRERSSLAGNPHSLLAAAARNLRLTEKEDDKTKGSELAEAVLYGIMKHHYGALPVVPKIFHKQNTQDNAKGADSVHIVIEPNLKDFSIWFGEAKLYNSIENARLDSIVASVKESLRTDKLRKENSLITNLTDLELLVPDDDLRNSILEALAPKISIDLIKPILHIPILLLHECEITKGASALTAEYKQRIINFHTDRAVKYFEKQINAMNDVHLYSEIRFHLILFPLPSKDTVVDKFIASAKAFRG